MQKERSSLQTKSAHIRSYQKKCANDNYYNSEQLFDEIVKKLPCPKSLTDLIMFCDIVTYTWDKESRMSPINRYHRIYLTPDLNNYTITATAYCLMPSAYQKFSKILYFGDKINETSEVTVRSKIKMLFPNLTNMQVINAANKAHEAGIYKATDENVPRIVSIISRAEEHACKPIPRALSTKRYREMTNDFDCNPPYQMFRLYGINDDDINTERWKLFFKCVKKWNAEGRRQGPHRHSLHHILEANGFQFTKPETMEKQK